MTPPTDRRVGRIGPSRPIPLVVAAYGGVTVLAVIIGVARGAPNVLLCAPMHRFTSALAAHLSSGVLGAVLAAAVIALTRFLVRTQPWARALHEDLRPFARALGSEAVIPVALASAIGEEVLFRGALVPAIGMVWSSVVFGVLHQLRGRSRFTWVVFAAVVGLALAGIFRFTGSLLGPILAHAAINAANLRFLCTHDTRRTPQLGGLLGGDRSRAA